MNGQRLRERAAQYGVGNLENDELVAIVLGHRDTGHAKEVLDNAGGIDRLAAATADDHRRMHRVGPAAATRLSAAVELGRRTTIPRDDKPEKMTSPRMFARYLLPRYGAGATEQLGVLSLNSRYGLLRDIILTRGTVDETPPGAARAVPHRATHRRSDDHHLAQPPIRRPDAIGGRYCAHRARDRSRQPDEHPAARSHHPHDSVVLLVQGARAALKRATARRSRLACS